MSGLVWSSENKVQILITVESDYPDNEGDEIDVPSDYNDLYRDRYDYKTDYEDVDYSYDNGKKDDVTEDTGADPGLDYIKIYKLALTLGQILNILQIHTTN